MQWGEAWQDTGLVFTCEDGRMLRPDSLTYVFRKLATDAGLDSALAKVGVRR